MTAASTFSLSVVSPVYGCKGCLEELVDRIHRSTQDACSSLEVILVDDAGPDRPWARICELAASRPWLKAVKLARNFGQHYAICAGIERATGDITIVMDCDLQDAPEEIPKLIAAMRDGAEVALAQRIERQDSISKRLGSWAFFRVLSWMTGVHQTHSTANFGAYSRRVIDAINAMPERERCFPLMVRWTGFPTALVPVIHHSRSEGKSSYTFGKLFRLAASIILSYSDKPLRMVVRIGLCFSLIAFAMTAFSIFRYAYGDIQVAGFTSIVASIWLVGGMAIFSLGIIGLYLGQLFMEAKGRPYYLVSDEIR